MTHLFACEGRGPGRGHLPCVQAARRLEELPEVAAAFGDGRISYSKVRAITRATEPGDGVDGVARARQRSAAQLEKVVRGVHPAKAAQAAQADPELADWKLRTPERDPDHQRRPVTVVPAGTSTTAPATVDDVDLEAPAPGWP